MAYKIGSISLTATWDFSGHVKGDEPDLAIAGGIGTVGVTVSLFNVSASATADTRGRLHSIPSNRIYTATASCTGGATVTTHAGSTLNQELAGGSATITIPCDICFEFVPFEGANPFFAGVVDSPTAQRLRFFLVGNGNASASISLGNAATSGTLDVRGVEITPHVSCTVSADGKATVTAIRSAGGPDNTTVIVSNGEGSLTATLSHNPFGTNGGEGVGGASCATSGMVTFFNEVPSENTTTYNTAAASGSGASMVSATASNGGHGQAQCDYEAPRRFDLQGVLRAMEAPYPDTLTLSCARFAGDTAPNFTASSSFSRGYTQSKWAAASGANAEDTDTSGGMKYASNSAAADTFADISVGIVASSLTAVGDEPLARRILLHGKSYSGMSLSQAASFVVDDLSAGGATGTGGATATVGGGTLTIATAGTAGGASRAYSPAANLSGYRYLRVRFRSVGSANQPASIGINGSSWNITTGADGAYVERDIDLCAPDSVDPATLNDGWDTAWPRPTVASPTSGSFDVSAISVSGIPSGKTVEVDAITLVYHNAPTLDVLPTLYPSLFIPGVGGGSDSINPDWPLALGEQRQVSGSGTTSDDFVRRFLLANTDGRQTLETPDMWYSQTVGGGSGTTFYQFNAQSIQGFCALVNGTSGDATAGVLDSVIRFPSTPGWAATPAVAAPTAFVPTYANQPAPEVPYFANAGTLLASYLHGGGARFVYGSGWSFGFDLTSLSLSAQPTFDVVTMCGLEGDAWGHGGGAIGINTSGAIDTLSIRAAAILRAGAHGLVLGTDRKPKSFSAVEMRQGANVVSTGASRGADGWYHTTSTPFGKPPGAAGEVRPLGKTTPAVGIGVLYTRHRHRAVLCFATGSPKRHPKNLSHSAHGYYATVYRDPDANTIAFQRTAGGSLTSAADFLPASVVATGTSTALVDYAAIVQDSDGTLRVLFQKLNAPVLPATVGTVDVFESLSHDEGATWETPTMLIPGGMFPILEKETHGAQVIAAAFVPTGGDPAATDGTLQGFLRASGDPATPTLVTFRYLSGGSLVPIPAASGGFGLAHEYESASRWWLTCVVAGETDISHWYSADGANLTFTRVS